VLKDLTTATHVVEHDVDVVRIEIQKRKGGEKTLCSILSRLLLMRLNISLMWSVLKSFKSTEGSSFFFLSLSKFWGFRAIGLVGYDEYYVISR